MTDIQNFSSQIFSSQSFGSQAFGSQAFNSQAFNSQAFNSQAFNSQAVNSADSFIIPLGLSPSGQAETVYAKIRGKVSRYLARNLPSKKLVMRNTTPIISFTFDDVPASACLAGVPILERHGIRGTFYVAGAGFGRQSPVGLLATPDQLRAIWQRGHEIGCQTHHHSAVSQLSGDELHLEYCCNQDALKAIDSGVAVRNFAYPYGDLSFG